MHHVELSPLIQALFILLLVLAAVQIVRVTRWRGRLVLLAFVLVFIATNPSRARHVRALHRAVPEAELRRLTALVEYNGFLVASAASINGRLVSVGWLDRLFVGSLSCATLSTMVDKPPPTPRRSVACPEATSPEPRTVREWLDGQPLELPP